MKFIKKEFKTEVIWLFGILVVSVIIYGCYSGFGKLDVGIDIELHDTYFVFSSVYIILFLFRIICFIVYGIRVIKDRFKSIFLSVIWVVITGLMIMLHSEINKTYLTFQPLFPRGDDNGWTVYPPNDIPPPSGNEKEMLSPEAIFYSFKMVDDSFMITQVLLIVCLMYSCYMIGKRINGVNATNGLLQQRKRGLY